MNEEGLTHWGSVVPKENNLYIFSLCSVFNLCRWMSYSGTAVAQWLRCCATNRKVAGSIPDGVGIFH